MRRIAEDQKHRATVGSPGSGGEASESPTSRLALDEPDPPDATRTRAREH